MPIDELPDKRLDLSREPETAYKPLPLALGDITRGLLMSRAARVKGQEPPGNYMLGGATLIDFNDGTPPLVICQGAARVTALAFEGVPVPIHDREIEFFDERGRPVYEVRNYDRRVSITIKVDARPMMRELLRVRRSLFWLAHPTLRRLVKLGSRLVASVTRPLARFKRGKPGRGKGEVRR